MYGDCLFLNFINWIMYPTFSLKSLLWSRGDDKTWVVIYFAEKDSITFHGYSGQSAYCHSPWNVFVQYIEHLWTCHAKFPMNNKAILFYPNGLNLNLLMIILNCWGRFLLSVSFSKRYMLKLKFIDLLFIGSLIRTYLWKCVPHLCRVWFLLYILVLLLNNMILFHDWLPTVTNST